MFKKYFVVSLYLLLFLPMSVASASPRPKILFVGDSLTAGYGLTEEEAFPAQVEKLAQQAGYNIAVQNAGVSGDTSAGVLRRINWLLKEDYALVFLGIGANDGLRGLPLAELESNLGKIISLIRAALPNAKIVLAGMQLPLNFGQEYAQAFKQVFSQVAAAQKTYFYPFLLQDVAAKLELNQVDRIHPNAAGQKVVAQGVWGFLLAEGIVPALLGRTLS